LDRPAAPPSGQNRTAGRLAHSRFIASTLTTQGCPTLRAFRKVGTPDDDINFAFYGRHQFRLERARPPAAPPSGQNRTAGRLVHSRFVASALTTQGCPTLRAFRRVGTPDDDINFAFYGRHQFRLEKARLPAAPPGGQDRTAALAAEGASGPIISSDPYGTAEARPAWRSADFHNDPQPEL
jgi:hypothetical protein